jgi:hypothetical protein
MPKPNYQFEKRKKDLETKAKKEEKRLRKIERRNAPASGPTEGEGESAPAATE